MNRNILLKYQMNNEKVKWKDPGESQSQFAAYLRQQREEKKTKKQRMQDKREAHRPALSSPSEVITMLIRIVQTWEQEAR